MSTLWEEITRVPRPNRDIDFPRIDPVTQEPISKCKVYILTQSELQACTAAAEKYVREMLKDSQPKRDEKSSGYEDLYNNEVTVQLLCKALRHPTTMLDNGEHEPLQPSTVMFKKTMTQDEVGMLMRQYLLVQAELGPIVSHMDKEEVDVWVQRLGAAGASSSPLAFLSSEALTDLVMHLASRQFNSAMDIGLPGEQLEGSLVTTDE